MLFLPCRLNTQLVDSMADGLIAYMRSGGTLVVMVPATEVYDATLRPSNRTSP